MACVHVLQDGTCKAVNMKHQAVSAFLGGALQIVGAVDSLHLVAVSLRDSNAPTNLFSLEHREDFSEEVDVRGGDRDRGGRGFADRRRLRPLADVLPR